ncbi:hypothetical protein P153DRAFT_360491 [Dothidotthia symphoricarpi CBS 119687]|uniref:Uncharacterized protein n=1 Tax=Dothidotthia symphoricarpi CBS 119687 TaxID=1392245 RepID=A0A6A6A4L5_9PLEO|nr:uncharacterized protein P153DRAFT_360491 [Dothidotthia symphoricarpi CBS 119687]KAF2125541.1 hypothetical protein P153DRAFT_360491 [Dothidotthia symphoricarpi CBS 119687]
MSSPAANPNSLSYPPQASASSQPTAPLPAHHGSSTADSSALMPAVTPATTTRQSVALGALSNFWGNYITPTINGQVILPDSVVSTIIAHAHSTDAQELPSDLTASTGSLHSTTTTLTDTLPPTQSAAIRALNAPAFHSSTTRSQPAKSASSQTSLTSQPVVVRTYSGSRHTSRAGSGFNTPRSFAMNGHRGASALSSSLAGRSAQLPSVEDFSFSAILRAVDPEIRDAIDAIAEICARSRMSLADEYDAHLPPQGEITGAGPGWVASTGALAGRGRLSRLSQGWTAADNTLMSVPEASSSSERLAQENKTNTQESSKNRSQSAYGSLKSVISGGSGRRRAIDSDTFRGPELDDSEHSGVHQQQPRPSWAVHASAPSSAHPAITIVTSPTASNQLSFDMSYGMNETIEDGADAHPRIALSHQTLSYRQGASHFSPSASRSRSTNLSSMTSWLPWPRLSDLNSSSQQELVRAEVRLRDMLQSSRNVGKGKAVVRAV